MIRAPIVVAALITALCALAVSRLGGGGMLPYLVGINVATVVIYGWDKLAASFGQIGRAHV